MERKPTSGCSSLSATMKELLTVSQTMKSWEMFKPPTKATTPSNFELKTRHSFVSTQTRSYIAVVSTVNPPDEIATANVYDAPNCNTLVPACRCAFVIHNCCIQYRRMFTYLWCENRPYVGCYSTCTSTRLIIYVHGTAVLQSTLIF